MKNFAYGVFRIGRLFLLPYLILVLLMVIFEERLIFFPSPYDAADPEWTPSGLQFEDAWFTAPDGTKLHGWYCPAENPRALVLYAHGNAGHLAWRAPVMQKLQNELGVSAMIFDYRGYGRSEGKPNEVGILQDARAARDWMADRADVAPEEIVVMGRSLGGAVAVDLAAGDGARALIVESSFTSMSDVGAVHYPWLPVRTFLKTRLNSLEKISQFEGPTLISHGNMDEVVPFDLGKQLFEAAGEPKSFFVVPRGTHNEAQPNSYYVRLDEFFDELVAAD